MDETGGKAQIMRTGFGQAEHSAQHTEPPKTRAPEATDPEKKRTDRRKEKGKKKKASVDGK